ncbi:MAG: peptide chain release factor N(5)-glutamine methyltransferase [Planctomycetota bacterium]
MSEPLLLRRDWLRQTTARLAAAKVEAPQLVAQLVLAHLLELSKEQVITRDHHPLTDEQRAALDALIERRLAGEPLAYLVGSIEFYGHRIRVSPAVLVPRSETELLVEFALEHAPPAGTPWCLADIGTGSGCIPIAIAHANADVRAIATDVSRAALEIARENVWLHGLQDRITLHEGDLFDALPGELRGRIDTIVSNPPYIDPADDAWLRPEVLVQPHSALFAGDRGAGGMAVLHRLLPGAGEWLRPGGWLAMECGHDQAGHVARLAREQPDLDAATIVLVPDLAGVERVVAVARRA